MHQNNAGFLVNILLQQTKPLPAKIHDWPSFWYSEIPENVWVTRFIDKVIQNFSFPQKGGGG
jgi:hypothetical protein